MAKKPPPVPMLKGEKLVVPHFDEETGRVVYKVLFDPLPKPKPSPPTATAKRAMIVNIVRRDFPSGGPAHYCRHSPSYPR